MSRLFSCNNWLVEDGFWDYEEEPGEREGSFIRELDAKMQDLRDIRRIEEKEEKTPDETDFEDLIPMHKLYEAYQVRKGLQSE